MVRIQVRYSGPGENGTEYEFLHDSQISLSIQEITNNITEIANLQQQIHLLGLRLLPRLSALLHTRPQQAMSLHRALSEATSYASKDQVLHGKPLSSPVLRSQITCLEKEFAANCKELDFPESSLEHVLSGLELLQEDKVQLWWAGKELTRETTLRDYIGNNEKTKIMLRLQSHISNPACNSTSGAGGAPI